MKFFLIFCAVMGLCVNAFAQLHAVDGDSLEDENRRIRLEGIDAPEYKQYCFDENKQKYMCGQDSLKYLQNLMAGKKLLVGASLSRIDINANCAFALPMI